MLSRRAEWNTLVNLSNTLQHTATHCNTLQHTVTYWYSLQHTFLVHTLEAYQTKRTCKPLQHDATHCNILQHTVAHRNTDFWCKLSKCTKQNTIISRCNTLQHYTALQYTATHRNIDFLCMHSRAVSHGTHFKTSPIHRNKMQQHILVNLFNTLQQIATHCHTATHCNTLQRTATHCNTLQHTATHRNVNV